MLDTGLLFRFCCFVVVILGLPCGASGKEVAHSCSLFFPKLTMPLNTKPRPADRKRWDGTPGPAFLDDSLLSSVIEEDLTFPRRYLQEDDGRGSQTEARDPLSDN